MPYALVAAGGQLFAGLADGQIWASNDGGDGWTRLRLHGDGLPSLVALAHASD
jgi:hypothetical protein